MTQGSGSALIFTQHVYSRPIPGTTAQGHFGQAPYNAQLHKADATGQLPQAYPLQQLGR